MMRIDARLPVRFGALRERGVGDAVLLDSDAAAEGPVGRFVPQAGSHGGDCACCAPRAGAALALAALFRERAVGAGRAFSGVLAVVSPAGEAAVREALVTDPLVAGRYRLA